MLILSAIKAARPKPYHLPDFDACSRWSNPPAPKLWRWRYLRPGTWKENVPSFDSFPTVTLKDS